MSSETFQTVDPAAAGPELTRLRQHVARTHGRVELTGSEGESCVVISKAELESLERALELLADTGEVRDLCAAVSHLAREAIST